MDSAYLEFCTTDEQRRTIRAVIDEGSQAKAARALGKHPRSIERMLGTIRLQAAQRGYSPAHDMTHATPPTHALKGTSTLYDSEGRLRQQWVKTEPVQTSIAATIQATAQGLTETIPREKPTKPSRNGKLADLHNLYLITDYHLGMLAWGEECGEDWDLSIAEDTLLAWFGAAIVAAPDSESCTFAQLGDFLHWDGLEALTPASKHVLDADTRFQKVVRSAIRVLRRIIRLLLTKHNQVHIIMADANHDPASGVWLREWLSHVYEDESRVTVDTSPDTYYCKEFGQTALMFHHGHKRNLQGLDSVLVGKFREVYGRTQYHYAHAGHLHHDRMIESNLMHIEQHETLAPKDAYASRAGYLSKRSAKCITYHRTHGEVSRVTIRPEMLK